jgi:hypothetical protein
MEKKYDIRQSKTVWIMNLSMLRLFYLISFTAMSMVVSAQSGLPGAWERMEGETRTVSIITDNYFSVAYYRPDAFVGTLGGRWDKVGNNRIRLFFEFDTQDAVNVGTEVEIDLSVSGDKMMANGDSWTRIDDGSPGALHDAWLMTGRKQGGTGEMQTRQIGPRKTMKILSGTRFQWIAYNSDTKEFSGTGGGTYTTIDGKYIENIEFFSRDNTRIGASLPFDYQLVEGAWHHSGKSSRGDPMYEVWSRRSTLE